MAYTRRISKRFSLRLLYSHHQFNYHSDLAFRIPETTYYRYAWRWGISAGYSIATGSVPIRITAGLARCSGAKLIFYGFSPYTGEPKLDGPGYTKLGGSLGISIGHPIVWRFFGELEGEYLRVNTDLDPAQLYLSYRIGFKF
ncbi:MAG TPA: hypothetical protein PK971_03955 [Saprospiraceae bacterium]|nr:hypothetical protein [Saprospiraceae bacterium]